MIINMLLYMTMTSRVPVLLMPGNLTNAYIYYQSLLPALWAGRVCPSVRMI
jgi:hypothetical protein